MSFLKPLAFAWLAVMVPVVAMYFLKLKRKKQSVSSTWLWVRSIQDLRVNAPFQRLRKSLLLILQLLLIALATLAIASPAGVTAPPEDKRWVLLIDRSASMKMKDVAPSRLEKAKEMARSIVNGTGPHDEIMVIAFSNRAQVLSPFTVSKPDAVRAIDQIEPTDAPTRIEEAFRIAASAAQGAKKREIVILSDGRFEPIQAGAEDVEIRYVPVGAEAKNAAITALDVRKPARTGDPWTIFAHIDLFSAQETEVPVEAYVNGQLKGIKKIKLAPNTGLAAIFEVSKPDPEVVEVRIAMEDDLDADNRAWFVVRQGPTRILQAGKADFFLEKALTNVKDAEVYRTDDPAKASLGDYEIVVLDGAVPDNLPPGKYLILGAVPKWEGVKATGDLVQPIVADWNRRHPATRSVNFSGLYIKSAPKLELPGFATPVVDTSDSSLIFSWEKDRTRAIVVAFNILDSDWPLHLSFPMFIANALEWLRDEGRAHPRPGEPLRIPLQDNDVSIEIATPAGKVHKLVGEKGRDVVFGDTDFCGLYTVTHKTDKQSVSFPLPLNLMDPQESSGTVAKELRIGADKTATASFSPPAVKHFWPWLALAVLLILLGEWFVYHRRVDI